MISMQNGFFQVIELPKLEWDFYWHHIYLPGDIKEQALRLIMTEHKIGSLCRVFALSRTTFFIGPPGCGKTTGVKGICNEAAKKLNGERCFFAELKFPSLCSHNYGESIKLIANAFKYIEELASADCIVFNLFDEIESILTNRALTLSDANPVDAFRGVNEVLKWIDELSLNYPKVFCFGTSNLLSGVDEAFVDRTDRTFYIGFPNCSARAYILKDLCETLNKSLSSSLDTSCDQFRELVHVTDGFSGRKLRKLPADAISSSDELSKEPSKIRLDDLVRAAQNLKESRKFRPRSGNHNKKRRRKKV
jgi:SpoVK/Ycf46/Vps4 family AAA+-type ATPase